ncbi:MAG: dipeptidase [Lachnospiraceae bacterium]|nr:dipeptidase [Lachnospiraceae bacterium]MDE6940271.1 dipeptidase [Lachnospiraceae bacterium]
MKIADMHCDTISEIWESRKQSASPKGGRPQQLSRNDLHIDIRKMKKAGYLLQNFALYVDLKKGLDPFEYVMELIDVFREEMGKNKSDIGVIKTYDEILANERQGKMSALMTIEEGGCCKGEIGNLERLYQLGARMMTLTWNYPNELASPNLFLKNELSGKSAEKGSTLKNDEGFNLFDSSKGLTEKGFFFIQRMEELGMIIDVSHLSDAGFWDIVQHTKKPFVASHSNARALCGHCRNLTDDMIRAVAGRGGVIGLNFYGCFLNETNDSHSRVARMAAHARHMLKVGGSGCLGLGSDFDGISGELEIQDCSQMQKLVDGLERAHFTSTEIENILWRNVMRVYREML